MASFIVLAIGLTIVLSVLVYVGHAVHEFVVDPQAAVAVPLFCPAAAAEPAAGGGGEGGER